MEKQHSVEKSAPFAILNMIMKSSDLEADILGIVQHSGVLISHLVIELDSHITNGGSLLVSHEGNFRSSVSASHLAILCSLATEPVALLQGRAFIPVGNVPDVYISNVSPFVFPYFEKNSPAPRANMTNLQERQMFLHSYLQQHLAFPHA